MSLSRRTVLSTAAVGLASVAAANAQTPNAPSGTPQPTRPGRGGTDPGPRNVPVELQNPDIYVPPATDHGTVANLKFPFSQSHMRLERGGWTRQVTERELGISKNIAGVDMRLNTGGVRELHWHKAAEWAYMLYGRARITAVDQDGRNFADDVGVGDLWYFPAGIPHSIQGLEPDGCEFLLVFDDGSFSEDNTFLISDWFKHVPPDVLAKNFGVPASSFAGTPDPSELYIFPLPVPGPLASDRIAGATPVPQSFSHRLMAQDPIRTKRNGPHHRFQEFPGVHHDRRRPGRDPAGRDARAALASQHRRMAILHRGTGPHGCVRLGRRCPHLRLSGRRRRLRSVCHGPLHREYRQHAAAVSRNVQEQLLRRCLAQPLDGADSARAGARNAQARRHGNERVAQRSRSGRAGLSR
jgi:quercetin dioxygenase-like cupin family protein